VRHKTLSLSPMHHWTRTTAGTLLVRPRRPIHRLKHGAPYGYRRVGPSRFNGGARHYANLPKTVVHYPLCVQPMEHPEAGRSE
jgi:hypothetical protein